jgi:DNA-binding transcriptional MerR regulator
MTEGHRDTDTVTRNTDTDTDTVMMVSAETAARLAGVSVRTIRRWMQHDHLPFVEGSQGKLISPADLPLAKERASSGHSRGHETSRHGHGQGHERTDTVTNADMTTNEPSPAAVAQLEAIRDEWLRPLVDRIEVLSKEVGRLEAERDALWSTVERLEMERDALLLGQRAPVAANEGRSEAMPAAMTSDAAQPDASFWSRFWRALTGR